MPLTIQPLQSLTVFNLPYTVLDTSIDIGPIHLWVGNSQYVKSLDSVVSYSTKGTIKTTKSLWVKRAHNCDNMQLYGDLLDIRFLPGWVTIPIPGRADLPEQIAYPNALGSYTPATIFCEWGKELFFQYRNASSYPMIIVVIANTDHSYVDIEFSLSGAIGNRYSSVVAHFVHIYDGGISGPSQYRPYNLNFSMNGRVYDYFTLESYILPTLRTKLNQTFWTGAPLLSPVSRYSPACSPKIVEDYQRYYAEKSPEWLTCLDTMSKQEIDFGELHYRALCKIDGFSGNGFAYLKDLKELIKEAKSVWSLLKGKVTPKSVSSIYLSYRYGALLTAKDTRELIDAMKIVSRSGVSATEEFTNGHAIVKQVSTIRYQNRDSVVEDCYQFFRYLDLLPNPENLWDLIPFSFVVDWFLNIGNTLERLDKLDLITHLNVEAVFDSYTATMTVPASALMLGVVGNINIRRYSRYCHWDASFPLIVPNSPSSTSHWLEGAALVIQRLWK